MLLLFNFTAYAQTENSTSDSCSSKIKAQEDKLSASVNQDKAIALANIMGNFTSIAKTENFEFSNIWYDWKIDNRTCSVNLQNVNVVYRLWIYCCGNEVAFQEDPNLTTVTKITFSPETCGTYCPAGGEPVTFPLCTANQTKDCVASPLKQYRLGYSVDSFSCSDHLTTVMRKIEDGSPACVSIQTAQSLADQGWGIILEYFRK